ncbi:MAG: signal peptidase II [Eubacteriales bacterium]|nr:signal peptidase II [Eubacteriales bacterium]
MKEKRNAGQCLKDSAFVLIMIVFDQLTKQAAVRSLKNGAGIPLLPGILELTYVQNRGAAFGILQDARIFFFLITCAALLLIGSILLKIPEGQRYLPMRICLLIITAGAIGNLIDRILLSYVRDFIYFSLIDFPVFNVADIYITCATFAMVLLTLVYYKEEDDFAFLSAKKK